MNQQIIDMFDLSGRVALITGGASGIGKGCAEILSESGAIVFIVDCQKDKLEKTEMKLQGNGGICSGIAVDLTVEENCKKAVEQCVKEFGRLDIVVNSAGTRGAHGDLEQEFSTENFEKTMAVDLGATFMTIKYAYPECAKNGVGSIINISSLAALFAKGPVVYSAAKGAVKSMGKTLGSRFGEIGVRVNTIYPGFIVTEMTEGIFQSPELEKRFRSESPLHLLGKPRDIAMTALYLASDASRFVTGQDFVIDGGSTC